MSAPHDGYAPQGYPNADPYAQQQYQQHDGVQQGGVDPGVYPDQTGSPPPAGPQLAGVAGRKKRAYAGQAFDIGSGANASLGGQQPTGGEYPGGAAYGGYPQQPQPGFQQGGFGGNQMASPPQSVGYQQPQAPGVGGYQSPDPGYPGYGASPGIGGVAEQFGQMHIGAQQQQPPLQMQQRAQPLNMLYPTDLVNQPFQVSELDLPPPPIILPQNVRSARILQALDF